MRKDESIRIYERWILSSESIAIDGVHPTNPESNVVDTQEPELLVVYLSLMASDS